MRAACRPHVASVMSRPCGIAPSRDDREQQHDGGAYEHRDLRPRGERLARAGRNGAVVQRERGLERRARGAGSGSGEISPVDGIEDRTEQGHAERTADLLEGVAQRSADTRRLVRQPVEDGEGGDGDGHAHADADHEQPDGDGPVAVVDAECHEQEGRAGQDEPDRGGGRRAERPGTPGEHRPGAHETHGDGGRAQPGLERGVPVQHLQLLGDQEQAAADREHEAALGGARPEDTPPRDRADIDHRVCGAQLPPGERRGAGQRGDARERGRAPTSSHARGR